MSTAVPPSKSSETGASIAARCLVVDDDECVRLALKRILSRRGHDVVVSASADDALKRASTGTFDVVLTDVHMPGMNGLDFARWVRDTHADTPVILVTGDRTEATVAECLSVGALSYVAKPFDRDGVLAEVERALRKRRMDQSSTGSAHACVSACNLQNIMERLDDAVAIVADGRVVYANTAANRFLGNNCDEFVGCTFPFSVEAGTRRDIPITSWSGQRGIGQMCVEPTVWSDAPARLVLVRDVSSEREATEHLSHLAAALDQIADAVLIMETDGTIVYVNAAFEQTTGYPASEAVPQNIETILRGPHNTDVFDDIWLQLSAGETWSDTVKCKRRDGTEYDDFTTISPVRDKSGKTTHFVAAKRDVTEQMADKARSAQRRKLAAIGELAAGIAHEINTPTQYITDNTTFLQQGFHLLLNAVDNYQGMLSQLDEGVTPSEAILKDARQALRRCRVDYLKNQVPRAIEQSIDGLKKVSRIVSAMKEFSHPGTGQQVNVDLKRTIENVLTVSRNEWKYVAEASHNLPPDLPPVLGYPDDLGQALLNIVVNAAHAIEGALEKGDRGQITISAREDLDAVLLQISDTGPGIPAHIQDRVFDPFFTTKKIGKGTGQGLAIAYNVIVNKHKGTLAFESEPGKGTVFTIRLPLKGVGEEAIQ